MPIPKLGVNIDHIATIRQARQTFEPDPVIGAGLATLGGAEIITCHLREDRRHVNDRDLELLKKTVFSKLNLEMAVAPDIVKVALKTQPEQVTLVPEKRAEVTTEGGLDVAGAARTIAQVVSRLKRKGIIVSLFVDAVPDQLRAVAECGAHAVELHTGPYANASNEAAQEREMANLVHGANLARELGLRVNAGHGLTYTNIQPLLKTLDLEELHIGHSIVSRAVLVGMERAVRDMCDLIARHCAS